MSDIERDQARARAWQTRRERYGPRGHAGSYSRGSGASSALRIAREALARLCNEGVLSEGQAARACSLDRIDFRALCDKLRSWR